MLMYVMVTGWPAARRCSAVSLRGGGTVEVGIGVARVIGVGVDVGDGTIPSVTSAVPDMESNSVGEGLSVRGSTDSLNEPHDESKLERNRPSARFRSFNILIPGPRARLHQSAESPQYRNLAEARAFLWRNTIARESAAVVCAMRAGSEYSWKNPWDPKSRSPFSSYPTLGLPL